MLHFGLPFPFVFALFYRSGWNWPLSINSSSSLNVKITQDTLFTYLMNINPCQDFSGALTEQQSRVWRVLEITLDECTCVCVRVMQFSIACHNCMQSAWQSSWAVMHELIISIVCSCTHSHLHVLKTTHLFKHGSEEATHNDKINHIKRICHAEMYICYTVALHIKPSFKLMYSQPFLFSCSDGNRHNELITWLGHWSEDPHSLTNHRLIWWRWLWKAGSRHWLMSSTIGWISYRKCKMKRKLLSVYLKKVAYMDSLYIYIETTFLYSNAKIAETYSN